MKWKTKVIERNVLWHDYLAILPVKTMDGHTVMFETVLRKWKLHMDHGKYVYKLKDVE